MVAKPMGEAPRRLEARLPGLNLPVGLTVDAPSLSTSFSGVNSGTSYRNLLILTQSRPKSGRGFQPKKG